MRANGLNYIIKSQKKDGPELCKNGPRHSSAPFTSWCQCNSTKSQDPFLILCTYQNNTITIANTKPELTICQKLFLVFSIY